MQRCALLLLISLSLTGCYLDPYKNPTNWSMTGASRQNIALQAANPSDLIAGRSNPTANGVAATAGVDKALGGAAGTGAGLLAAPTNLPSMNITGS